VFHDLASAGVSEPMLRVESEQPRDDVLEAVPPDRLLRPFVIQHQDIVEYRVIAVSLGPEWLDTETYIMSENPFRDSEMDTKIVEDGETYHPLS